MFHNASSTRNRVVALGAAVALAASAMILPAAASAQATIGYWGQYRFGPTRAGFNPFETELTVSNVTNLRNRTVASMGGVVQGAPAVVDGVAYAFATDGRLYAIRLSTGKRLWRTTVGKALNPAAGFGLSSPAVGSSDHPRVFVGTPDGKVVAVRAADGRLMWSASTGRRIVSSPAFVNGIVYVGSNNHNVYAFRASDGKRLWRFTTGGAVESSPAVVGGTVYIGSDDHKVYALAARNGARRWVRGIGGKASTPAVVGTVLYVTSSNGRLYALATSNGAVKWSAADAAAAPFVPHAPAVARGRVFTTGVDTTVRAFSARTGAPIWNTGALGEGTSDAAVANGVVYVGTTEDKLVAFNASSGKRLFGTTGGAAAAYFDPVVTSGSVVLGVNPTGAKLQGTLHAYELP